MLPFLLAQTVEDIRFEMQRLQRNYEFLSYGLIAAWVPHDLLHRQSKATRQQSDHLVDVVSHHPCRLLDEFLP